jgi:hypothetical protein
MGISPSEACYHGCVITTENGRIGDRRRWIMLIQEYHVMIKHVRVARHYIADVISRDPTGLTQDQIKQIIKPRDIMVTVINLNIDPQVRASLKRLGSASEQWPLLNCGKQKSFTIKAWTIVCLRPVWSTSCWWKGCKIHFGVLGYIHKMYKAGCITYCHQKVLSQKINK